MRDSHVKHGLTMFIHTLDINISIETNKNIVNELCIGIADFNSFGVYDPAEGGTPINTISGT